MKTYSHNYLKQIAQYFIIPLNIWSGEINKFIQTRELSDQKGLLEWLNAQGKAVFEKGQMDKIYNYIETACDYSEKFEWPGLIECYELIISFGFQALSQALKTTFSSINNLDKVSEKWISAHKLTIAIYAAFMGHLTSCLVEDQTFKVTNESINKLKVEFFEEAKSDLLKQISLIKDYSFEDENNLYRNSSSPFFYK